MTHMLMTFYSRYIPNIGSVFVMWRSLAIAGRASDIHHHQSLATSHHHLR